MFYTYVASVLSGYCTCFSMAFQVFSGVFASISYAYFKRFICLHIYVANILSECFKNRSGVVIGDPPATVGVRARKVEGARAVSV
jgi:hypothetical protein